MLGPREMGVPGSPGSGQRNNRPDLLLAVLMLSPESFPTNSDLPQAWARTATFCHLRRLRNSCLAIIAKKYTDWLFHFGFDVPR